MEYANILAIVGGVTILVVIACILFMVYEFVTDKIRNLKWEYKYKHRFDKSPTAKCYCKDCFYFKPYSNCRDSGRCGRGHIENWTVCDNNFCWQAEPCTKDPETIKPN